ncbi:MAG: amidohydrolase [Christensenellaceae bacterium]|nr:amidohydrolase [Christensenellaceae bacterium]MCI7376151.1 amidohydrolase [Christensenellaceae bacterium]MDD7495461.1 amidohydrolase [Christensenellaceae bacterium]MDY5718743.1 amidohydrolase [Eubacteriales bacterium]
MLLLKNGNVMTMAGPAFVGDVAIENGKIVAVGQSLSYSDAEVRDVTGMTVMPGIVDPHCHIGMWEDAMGFEGADGNECTNPITPELRAIDAINPYDRCFEEAVAGGVTTCVTGPGSANVIGGQFVAIKTYGDSVEDMVLRFPVAVKAAFGENPKRVYNGKNQTPSTRMATAALMRKALIEAQEYNEKLERGKADPEKMPERNLGKEILARVMRRELPMKIHAHRADDILTAIRICREFKLRYTLDHCTEGYLITDKLKEALSEDCEGIIVGPLLTDRSKIELKNLSFKAPKVLEQAGIEYAMMTDHPVTPEQYLPICTAVAVREGASEEGALKAITINAAKITGIADRVGSIEVGKDADIAVFSGHPFDFRSRCVLTLVNGKVAHEEH